MAKRVTRPRAPEVVREEPDDDEVDTTVAPLIPPEAYSPQSEMNPDEEALQRFLADMPTSDNAGVSVYRLGLNRKHSFLFSFTPGELDYPQLLAKLRDEYEGGNFRVHGRNGAQLVFNEFVSVEAPKRKPITESDIDALVRAKLSNAQPSTDQTAMLAQMMQQGFAQIAQALTQSRPVLSPEEQEDRFMQRMIQMKTLFDRPAQAQPEGSGIETFLKGLEFGKSIMEGVGEASELDVMRDAVKSFGPALLGAMQQGGAPSQAATPTPPARPRVPAPKPLAQAVNDNMKALQIFYIGRMVNAAKQDSDPYAYAVSVVDEFDEAKIREFIGAPDSFDKIAALVPEAANYRPWFEAVAKEAIAILDGEEDEGDDGGIDNAPGEADDTPAG